MPGLLGRICNIYPVYPGCWIYCRIKNYRDKKTKTKKTKKKTTTTTCVHILSDLRNHAWNLVYHFRFRITMFWLTSGKLTLLGGAILKTGIWFLRPSISFSVFCLMVCTTSWNRPQAPFNLIYFISLSLSTFSICIVNREPSLSTIAL